MNKLSSIDLDHSILHQKIFHLPIQYNHLAYTYHFMSLSKLSLNTEITKFKLHDLQLHHHWVAVCHLYIFIS